VLYVYVNLRGKEVSNITMGIGDVEFKLKRCVCLKLCFFVFIAARY